MFRDYGVWPIDHYTQALHSTLCTLAPVNWSGRNQPTVVLLTPGVFNSAYFEHTFLAQQMGIELVEGRDLLVHDNVVYMRTTAGLRRVDVIYRRVDDDFIDPLMFPPRFESGCSRIIQRVSRRQCDSGQCDRDRRCRRQGDVRLRTGDHPLLPGRRPILPNVPTYLLTDDSQRQYVLEHLDELVVKAVGESGGYGMLIGPHSTAEQREEFRHTHQSRAAQLHRAADAEPVARSLLPRWRGAGAARRSSSLHSLR